MTSALSLFKGACGINQSDTSRTRTRYKHNNEKKITRGQELGQGKTQIQFNHTISRGSLRIAAAAECQETSRRTLQKDQQSMNLTHVLAVEKSR